MKIVTATIAIVVSILAITTVMIPTLADNVPHDTTYSNIPEGGALYTYYEGAAIPNLTIQWNGTKMTVNGSNVMWGNNTPAVATSALTVASQTGNNNPNITHLGIATDEEGHTTYGSQISGLTEINLSVTSGKISGTVKTSNHTYTITETALSWAYVQEYGGKFTAIDNTSGYWYTTDIKQMTYQYRNSSTSTYTVHDGKVTNPNGDTIATLTNASFTSTETIFDKDGVTVYKIGLPLKTYNASTSTWALVNTDVVVDDHKETTEEKILNLVPLLLMVSLILGVVGLAVRRN